MVDRSRLRVFYGLALGLMYLALAWVQGTGYSWLVDIAQKGPAASRLAALLPWIAAAGFAVAGAIVILAAWLWSPLSRPVLAVAGCLPAIVFVMQVAVVGFASGAVGYLTTAFFSWAAAVMLKDVHSQ